LDAIRSGAWTFPVQVWAGSLYGYIRDWVGVVNLSYLQVDDPALYTEMIDTLADLTVQGVKAALEHIPADIPLDYGHMWEDICFKSGPLVKPAVFREKIGPHYRHITDLLHSRGVNLVSLDCDGKIDALVPIWLENGINVMYPIEVGVWNASIKPWREKYGRELRGVGGMDKRVFAFDRPAIDAEVERLKELVDLGGYIPCPDHRLPPDAKWENVLYYTDHMRQVFG
jgi:uroporphyrinogen decarboxylase